MKLGTAERLQLPPIRLPPLPTERPITVVVQAPTNDVARETTIFLTGATREPVAHTGDPLPLRLPFGASSLIEAVAPTGYRIIQPLGMRIMPDDTDKTLEFRVETMKRLYQSIDNGTTWSRLAPNGPLLNAIVPGGRSLYATGSGEIWRSEDGGATCVRMLETALTAITARGPKIYASVFHPAALARSLDDGRTWTDSHCL